MENSKAGLTTEAFFNSSPYKRLMTKMTLVSVQTKSKINQEFKLYYNMGILDKKTVFRDLSLSKVFTTAATMLASSPATALLRVLDSWSHCNGIKVFFNNNS